MGTSKSQTVDWRKKNLDIPGHTCSMHACIGGRPCTIHLRLLSGRYKFARVIPNNTTASALKISHSKRWGNRVLYLFFGPFICFHVPASDRASMRDASAVRSDYYIGYMESDHVQSIKLEQTLTKAASRNAHSPWPRTWNRSSFPAQRCQVAMMLLEKSKSKPLVADSRSSALGWMKWSDMAVDVVWCCGRRTDIKSYFDDRWDDSANTASFRA